MSADSGRKSKKLIGICVCMFAYALHVGWDLDGLRQTYVDLECDLISALPLQNYHTR